MKKLLMIALLLGGAVCCFAHRLDEYLQATLLSVKTDRVVGSMRLVPGVSVASAVIANIDANGDGTLSQAEMQSYAERVLRDLLLSVDGVRLEPRLIHAEFPTPEQMREGMGEIRISFAAALPRGGGKRSLVFENHHESGISVYMVNCLVPQDQNIAITGQTRNENQSFYQVDFADRGATARATRSSSLFTGMSGFAGAFRLGVRHIAEGTDHLLFLLALLLPAPLMARQFRWREGASTRRSLLTILRIVTAFTVGHSLTLMLAAAGLVQVPSRPVEVLIAVSILVSALHAMRPLFPGPEMVVAAFFGLIHGMAFATALRELGFGRGYLLVSILGFNLGIEAMQLGVVAATLPSLLLLSRTRAYAALRIGGALFAAVASVGWVLERALGIRNVFDPVVEGVARHAGWIACGLLAIAFLSRFVSAAGGEARMINESSTREAA